MSALSQRATSGLCSDRGSANSMLAPSDAMDIRTK